MHLAHLPLRLKDFLAKNITSNHVSTTVFTRFDLIWPFFLPSGLKKLIEIHKFCLVHISRFKEFAFLFQKFMTEVSFGMLFHIESVWKKFRIKGLVSYKQFIKKIEFCFTQIPEKLLQILQIIKKNLKKQNSS